jgi:uncharacterized Ntn-hydrolase superfamily protein
MELERLVHTYSIVARDPVTGEMGGAVQSHYFRSGAVLSGEPGVGVVASQASGDPSYGSLGLALMRSGRSPPADALRGLMVADPHGGIRQVARWSTRRDGSQRTPALIRFPKPVTN